MANPFDQFDAPAAAPADTAAAAGPNPFDQFDAPAAPTTSLASTAGDVANSFGSGVTRGTLGLPGLPGDVQQASNSIWDNLSNKAIHGLLSMTGQIKTPEDEANFQKLTGAMKPGAGDSLPTSSQILGGVDQVMNTDYTPTTTAGAYAKTAGEFLPNVITGPEGLTKKLALGVAAPAVASEALGQATKGTDMEGPARMAGAFAGGVGAPLVTDLAKGAAGKIADIAQPMRASGQEAMAGQMLHDAASDPAALQESLANPAPDLVPGSKPTTFQATGDLGIGSAEKTAEVQNPVPFNQRRFDQNQARVDALSGIQPGGAPEDLAAGLKAHLNALDDAETGNVTAATTQAQNAASGLGGEQSPAFYGQGIQDAVQPQVDAATGAAQRAVDGLGGTSTAEDYGATMRNAAASAKATAKTARNDLYKAIDPDGTLNAVATGPRQSATELSAGISPLAAQPAGEEAAILDQMKTLPSVVPFRDLQALDARLTAARTAEYQSAGESPAWGRMGQLKGSVQDAISNGVAHQVEFERHAVTAGDIAPEATMEARLAAHLQDKVNAFYADRNARAAGSVESDGSYSGPGQGSAVGVSGARSQAGRGSGSDAGAEGISAAPLVPNFDQAAAERLDLAKQTHAAYSQTFKDGPVGQMLKTNGFAGQYKMLDSGVPNQVFTPGPSGPEKLQAFAKAVGDNPSAGGAVRNYAAMSLRRAAENPDGTLNTAKLSNWIAKHQDTLRAMPDLMKSFGDAGRASEALKKFEPFTKAQGPSAIPEMFFHSGPSGGEGVKNLRELIGDQSTASTLTDYAASRLRQAAMNPDGTLDPRKVAIFTKTHKEALDALPGLGDRFADAAKATDTVNAAAAARKTALDSFQKDAVGKLVGVDHPDDVSRIVGGVFARNDAVKQMGDLASKARVAGPDAVQGLRKATAAYIEKQFMANAEAGTSGTNKISANAFQTFVKKNAAVLGKVFKPEEVASMQAIADDIARANRSRDAINVPGQSQTAQLHNQIKLAQPEHSSWLEALFKGSFAGREIGEMLEGIPLLGPVLGHVAGPLALGAGVAKHLVAGAQAAGLKRVGELYQEALLNPEIAHELLGKVKPAGAAAPGATFGTKLARLAPFYGQQMHASQPTN